MSDHRSPALTTTNAGMESYQSAGAAQAQSHAPATVQQTASSVYALQSGSANAQPIATTSKGSLLRGWFDVTKPAYLKGALIGAGIALVLGHPKVRKKIIAGAVSAWDMVSGGLEELKEQVEDVRAEKSADK